MTYLTRVNNDTAELSVQASNRLAEIESTIKAAKEAEEEIKRAIKEEMEQAGVISVETDKVKISYIRGSDRESFDSKAFRKDNPELYDEYVKIIKVDPSVRITLR